MHTNSKKHISSYTTWPISIAALNQTALDLQGNASRIIYSIQQSIHKNSSRLLLLPELSLTGYGCEDMFLCHDFIKHCEHMIIEILKHTKDIGVFIGLPILYQGYIYNAVFYLRHQKIAGIHCKKHLANYGVHYESRWFHPWPYGKIVSHFYAGQHDIPMGDIFYLDQGVSIGLEICEEAWRPSQYRNIARCTPKCHIVCNASASHFSLQKNTTRESLAKNSSKLFHAHYLYANLLGVDAGHVIYDGSLLWAQHGKIQLQSPRLTTHSMSLLHFSLKLSPYAAQTHKPQNANTATAPHLIHLGATYSSEENHTTIGSKDKQKSSYTIIHTEQSFHKKHSTTYTKLHSPTHLKDSQTPCIYQEFARSISLGLYDYLRKSHAHGFTISLSGGCDSSVMATLVATMIRQGIRELGMKDFLRSINREDLLAKQTTTKTPSSFTTQSVISALLSCIYLASQFSSQQSQNAAKILSKEIGASFHTHNIQHIIDHYIQDFELIYQSKLSWNKDSILLQNIQARVRAPMAWMLANAKKSILLCTANRSECSVGYMTMDGDSSGGIAPLSGVSKDFLLQWMKWAHTVGYQDLTDLDHNTKISAFQYVLMQKPTAELCPPDWKQSDENDLMPYDLMAVLEKNQVIHQKMLSQNLQELQRIFPQYNSKQLQEYIKKFQTLWRKNQWKRERIAMGFHIDDFNISPKSGYRYPVLS